MKPLASLGRTEQGYALVLVLVAIAVFLLFASETTARSIREIRVTKTSENSEAAFYAAEAGFNRVRARLTKQGDDTAILALDGRAETLLLDSGAPAGHYTIQVSKVGDQSYAVVSTGTAGTGATAGKRVVAGTISARPKPKPNPDYAVTTSYRP
ncbi:MAG: hypothetical protein JWN15_2787 [Firmicutes bacterium]|nr:hypothetical protein [Bacillota bacterium]